LFFLNSQKKTSAIFGKHKPLSCNTVTMCTEKILDSHLIIHSCFYHIICKRGWCSCNNTILYCHGNHTCSFDAVASLYNGSALPVFLLTGSACLLMPEVIARIYYWKTAWITIISLSKNFFGASIITIISHYANFIQYQFLIP